ncbi:MAG: hypothetical protein LBJ73_05140 [Rickettsiales bacterium]|nr:hypothetical protein [Rickettsiales bacterium]
MEYANGKLEIPEDMLLKLFQGGLIFLSLVDKSASCQDFPSNLPWENSK